MVWYELLAFSSICVEVRLFTCLRVKCNIDPYGFTNFVIELKNKGDDEQSVLSASKHPYFLFKSRLQYYLDGLLQGDIVRFC